MHHKLREEKNCLNCGNTVEERFCPHCGQENLELHDSTRHLVLHYFQDLVHYDGRFWHTLKNFFLKPGFVAKEYIEGRRVRNLKPIQLYVFASSVFFIVFFLIGPKLENKKSDMDDGTRLYHAKKLSEGYKNTPLQQQADAFYNNAQQQQKTADSIQAHETDSTVNKNIAETSAALKKEGVTVNLDSLTKENKESAEEDSRLEKAINKILNKKREKFGGDGQKMSEEVTNEFLHNLSKLFFISLPFFAFFLWLLHRNKTRRFYAQHFIFATYHYAYVFIVSLILLVVNYLLEQILPAATAIAIRDALLKIVFIYLLIYLGLSMRRFYNESMGKAFAKELVALALSAIVMGILLLGMAVIIVYL